MRYSLDRLYERLLFTYPRDHRAAHGEELVATAVELARPGQRLPSMREAVGFVFGGLRTRSRLARAGSRAMTWADGVRLGAAIVMAVALAGQIEDLVFGHTPLTYVLLAAMVGVTVALLRAARRLCLPLVALGLGLALYHASGTLLSTVRGGGALSVVFVAVAPAHSALEGMAVLVNPVMYALAGVVPFLLAAAALLWQPRAGRGPAVWPWWLVGLVVVLPVLPAVDGALSSESVLGVGLVPLLQLLWPALLLAVAIVTYETRLAVAVVVWALGSLVMNWGYLILVASPGVVGIVNPATTAAIGLVAALATTAVTNRRLARI